MGWQGSLLGCQMRSWSTVTRQQETTLQGTDAPTLVGGCTDRVWVPLLTRGLEHTSVQAGGSWLVANWAWAGLQGHQGTV